MNRKRFHLDQRLEITASKFI